jgi:RNA recognition motif-containing protein
VDGVLDKHFQSEMDSFSNHPIAKQIFVGDISKFCSAAKVRTLFATVGKILDVNIKRDNKTGKMLSYGFVTYANEGCANRAIEQFDGFEFFGRKLRYVVKVLLQKN